MVKLFDARKHLLRSYKHTLKFMYLIFSVQVKGRPPSLLTVESEGGFSYVTRPSRSPPPKVAAQTLGPPLTFVRGRLF